jgi:putative transposase
MQNKLEALQPDTFYHIYNRANGSERLFNSDENYLFFLRKYKEYILPICHTYCYCLMPNHFHFLIQIKSEQELELFFNQKISSNIKAFPKFKTLEKLISKQFSNFFSCYTQAFNKQQQRKGSMFIKNFKRKKITDTAYLLNLVKYIHYNPIEAKLATELNEWKFSSYAGILSQTPTLLKRADILEWYNDLANFKFAHKTLPINTDDDYLT